MSVFAPKYRRQMIYGKIKKDIGEILITRRLAGIVVIALKIYILRIFDEIVLRNTF